MWDFPLFPEWASSLARDVDILAFVWIGIAGVVALVVAGLIVVFAVKYRNGSKADRHQAPKAVRERRNRRIELAWIVAPLALFIAMFSWAAELYFEHAAPPPDAMIVYAVGKQWMWHLQHRSGRREIDELHVPLGQPVKLVMTSQDVIHSFFMPVFRIKRDVLPGRYTILWFTANKPGEYRLFCSQYCGTDHSRMIGRIVVMEPEAFETWLAGETGVPTMAARGAARFREYGCSGCHGPGSTVRAPRLEGVFGKTVPLQGGGFAVADERYIRDSLLLPNKEIVAGFAPIMPSYQGSIGEEDLLDVIEYLKSIGSVRQEDGQ